MCTVALFLALSYIFPCVLMYAANICGKHEYVSVAYTSMTCASPFENGGNEKIMSYMYLVENGHWEHQYFPRNVIYRLSDKMMEKTLLKYLIGMMREMSGLTSISSATKAYSSFLKGCHRNSLKSCWWPITCAWIFTLRTLKTFCTKDK